NVKSFDDPHVDIALRGGGLGASHRRWLSTGDVLTVARITGSGEQQRSTRIDWALLQVEPDAGEGVYRGRWLPRYPRDKLAGGEGVLGYRCLRLATRHAPLSLRLVQETTGEPLRDVYVEVRRSSFDGPLEKVAPRADGLAVSSAAYASVAFVRVL